VFDLGFKRNDGEALVAFSDFFHLEHAAIIVLFGCRLAGRFGGTFFEGGFLSRLGVADVIFNATHRDLFGWGSLGLFGTFGVEIELPLENAFVFSSS